jgi:beta-galactosidase
MQQQPNSEKFRLPHNLRKLLTLSLSSALLFSVARSQEQTPSSFPPLYLGTAWYPEQWPESRWDADLTLMEQAHVRFVRTTEFAWSSMEPTEGRYAFDWMDHAIAAAAKHYIYVVLVVSSDSFPTNLDRPQARSQAQSLASWEIQKI